ncbi:MAG TPA: methylated-DNA--[protein]-cysteine S-methyltransferase [Acidimicrobiia bacterium]|nr:methylated-DNA--[protein]-cysteine S-methyltransferase [Acidimicrobiia bacterium]
MTIENHLQQLTATPPDDVGDRVLVAVGLADEFVEWPSIVGRLFIAFNGLGVSTVSADADADRFEAYFQRRHRRPLRPATAVPETIERHLAEALDRGRPGRLPLDLRGVTPFQSDVLLKAATIPRGEVRPYGWIARELGNPGAVRAVGSALATNPIPLILPCHRVVRSDGSFGRYSLGSDDNKPRLLAAEGLDVAEYQRMARTGTRFVGSETTRIYCHPTCRAARTIAGSHRVELRSTSEAEDRGFRACKLCRPAA